MSAAEHIAHLILNDIRALAHRDGLTKVSDWKITPAQLARIVNLGPYGCQNRS